ncbi:MAG: Peptidase M16 inactive domain protein [Candidatus Hydrogenedentes bacterium ADurb.Bin101]|nr:MAG: Peptidase M16 inactive domain protein [Candidatus Hydrogenedentes bacterium ADurb.Bin101]
MESTLFPMLCFGVLVPAAAMGAAASSDAGRLDYQETVLDNGLKIITLEDFSCPIVTVDIWYHVGSKDENPERQGFAHMFEHMMFRGTDRLGPTDHFDNIRRIGGTCNGYTSFDQTVYVQTVPANQLELVLWLEAERMSFLKIDQAAFDTERKVVEEERRLGLNAPYGGLEEKALAEVFHVHPYRWPPIGKIPHLRAASVPELRSFWTHYYGPNNATLVIAGAVKHEEARSLAERYFGWIPRGTEPPRVTVREPVPEGPREVTLSIDNAPLPLAALAFRTVPLAHPDRVPLELLATILGDGNSSRAYRHLVAEKELAVGVQCMNVCLEQEGMLALGAAVPPGEKRLEEALAALKREIEQIRKRVVHPDELEKARNQMLSQLVMESLNVANKARALGSAAVLEGDTARVNGRFEAINRVTLADLLRVARQYLNPDRVFTFRVEGDLKGLVNKDKRNPEDDAPLTGQPETDPPAPGRPGAARPENYPASPPSQGPLEFDPTPRFQARTLDNGMKVVVVENHESPFVSMILHLRTGAWTETKPGCASMAMNMLCRGTEKHTEEELSRELETYAIHLSGTANMDDATVVAACVTTQVERAARLMADTVLTPTFDAEEFKKLKKQVLADLSVNAAEPAYLAGREMRRRLYGPHPYARSARGEVEDVRALTPDDARAWWSAYARPDMAWLCFAGDIGMEQAEQLAGRVFGSWKGEGPKPEPRVAAMPAPAPTNIVIVDMPGDQAQIRIARPGITRNDPGYFVSRVVSGYFGGAFGSRLNDSLRVRKGLTYGARGGYYPGRMGGEFVMSTFTKLESVPEAVQTSLEELDRLRSDAPTPEELGQTKAYILGSFAGERETPQAVANDLWLIESEGLAETYFRDFLAGVQAADAAACTRLATATLDPDTLLIVVTGPAATLRQPLEAIAPVTVVTRESRNKDRHSTEK